MKCPECSRDTLHISELGPGVYLCKYCGWFELKEDGTWEPLKVILNTRTP